MKFIFSIITLFSIISYANLILASTQDFSSFITNLENFLNDKTKSLNLNDIGIYMTPEYLNFQINQTYQTSSDLLLREKFSKLVNTIPPWSSKNSFIVNDGSEPFMFEDYSDIINNAEYNNDKTTFKFSLVKGQLLNYFRYSSISGEPGYYITTLNKPTENYDTTIDNVNDLFTIHQSYDFQNWDFNIGAGKTVVPVTDQFKIEFNLLKVDINRLSWFDPSLFTDKTWQYVNPGYVSDGNGNGILPKFITSLILIKNLNITLQQSTQNTDILKQINNEYYSTSGNSISFGPLIVKENDKVSNDVEFVGNSITIPEIQMIAVVSDNVPFSPIEIVTSTPQPTNQNQNQNQNQTQLPSNSNILKPSLLIISLILISLSLF
ncbi:hypothetical protein ACTFIR_001615 [Dictyostelium discoideum]